jgi:hypothetical protein
MWSSGVGHGICASFFLFLDRLLHTPIDPFPCQLTGLNTHLDHSASPGCLDAGAVVELLATLVQPGVGVHMSMDI